MSDPEIKASPESVEAFIQQLDNEERRSDCLEMLTLMKKCTGEQPVLWGGNIIGFGQYHYRYDSGREGDWFKVGFSPRKHYLSVYLTYRTPKMEGLRERLGKHKAGKSCLNVKKLEEIDLQVLEQLIGEAIQYINENYPS